MAVDTELQELIFQEVTQEEFDALDGAGQTGLNQFYLTPDLSTRLPIFTSLWADHKVNDMSWLNADTFSWQSGDVYVAAYEHLVDDIAVSDDGYITTENGVVFNRDSSKDKDGLIAWTSTDTTTIYTSNPPIIGETPSAWDDTRQVWGVYGSTISSGSNVAYQDTIGGITIIYYRAEDGHKICLPDQESNVQALYEKTGAAKYYVLDTENKQFKLPREPKDEKYQYFFVGNYTKSAIEQTAGITSEQLNNKADVSDIQALENRTDILEQGDYVVASQQPTSSNGYTWYRKYKSGWVEQGGRWTGTRSIAQGESGNVTPSLPIKMANKYYYVNAACEDIFCLLMNTNAEVHQCTFGWGAYTVGRTLSAFIWEVKGFAA